MTVIASLMGTLSGVFDKHKNATYSKAVHNIPHKATSVIVELYLLSTKEDISFI